MITLTREQIESEPAGPRMDNWIAEHAMEWTLGIDHNRSVWLDADGMFMCSLPAEGYYEDDEDFHLLHFHPSSSIMAFWMVIDKLDRKEWDIQIVSDTEEEGKEWGVSFYHYSEADALEHGSATADTVPLAGCRARLLAMLEREA